MRSVICVICVLLVPISTFSQTKQTAQQNNIWFQGFSTIRLGDRWSVPLEVQIRRADSGAIWQQVQFRTTVLYRANRYVTVGGGYAYTYTWPYGEQPIAAKTPEHRAFEQMNIRHRVKSIPVDHRLRLEQRYTRRVDPISRELLDEFNYTNRFRYQGGITIPIKRQDKSRTSSGDVFLFANDELFFNFGENVQRNKFDQNRVAAGVGYRLSPDSNFRVGYLHQYSQKSDGVRFESNHTITLSLTYNFSLW